MSAPSLRVCIPPLKALHARSELLALTQQAIRAGRHDPGSKQTAALVKRLAYEDHADFLAQLPFGKNQIDRDLVAEAVWHVSSCISRLERLDQGKRIIETWPDRRRDWIAAIPIWDKQAWAAEERKLDRQGGPPLPEGFFEQTLPQRADWYLNQILRHVTGNK